MKKFFAAVSCTLLITGMSFAQEATPVAAAAEAVQAVAVDATQAAATEAAPAVPEATPVAVPEAAPMSSDIVEGTIVNAPIVNEYSMTPIQSDCGCNGTSVMGLPVVSAPIVSADPVVTAPATSSPCGCGAAPAPAPVSSCCCEASAAAPVCCQPRQRRQIVRGAISNMRSRCSSCCCN